MTVAKSPEQRPAMQLIDVKGAELRNVALQKPDGAPRLVLESVKDLLIKDCHLLEDITLPEIADKRIE